MFVSTALCTPLVSTYHGGMVTYAVTDSVPPGNGTMLPRR